MSNLSHLSTIAAIVSYLAATVLLLRKPAPAQVSRRGPLILAIAWLGILGHATGLAGFMFTPQGIDLSFLSTAALVSLTIGVLFLLATLGRPVDKLGIAVFPLAATTLWLRLSFPSEVHLQRDFSMPMEIHILVSIIAFSLLNIAAIQAILLAIQDWQLHHKKSNWFVRSLPPLQTMETLLFQMIGAGFLFLSISLLSGFLFVEDLFAQHLVHKTVLSILSWGVFGMLLGGRWCYGWRGRTAIRWTLGGFAALLLAYFGSKLVLEIILRRV